MSQSYTIETAMTAESTRVNERLDKVAEVVAVARTDFAELYNHMASPDFALKSAIIRTLAALGVALAIGQIILYFVA